MSKLNVDAKEAATLVARLFGGSLTLKDHGFNFESPTHDLKCDIRRVTIEGVIQKGPISVDLKSIEIAEQGITLDFSIQ